MSRTITTFLIDGVPEGNRYAFISNRICRMYVVYRSNLDILSTRQDLQTPAFYVLLGEDEKTNPMAYIGETENFRERVKDHDSKKTFWQKALVFVAKDSTTTKADVQYLEYLAIPEARKANNYVLAENKQTPKEPNLPEHRKSDMDDFFEDVKLLTSFSGCNLFDVTDVNKEHIFYVKGRGCEARGFYSSKGFTVLKDSIIAKSSVPSLTWKDGRESLLKECTRDNGDKLILNTDKTFPTPSTAANFCLGSNNNGWLAWKDKDGQPLDDVYRRPVEK